MNMSDTAIIVMNIAVIIVVVSLFVWAIGMLALNDHAWPMGMWWEHKSAAKKVAVLVKRADRLDRKVRRKQLKLVRLESKLDTARNQLRASLSDLNAEQERLIKRENAR
jgi:hypothetical protein